MDYSPDVQAYLDALAAQRAQAVANGMYVSGSADDILLPRQVQEPASDSWDLVYPSEQDIRYYMSTHPTPSVDVGYMVPSWGSSRTPTGAEPVVLTAGGTYTLTDKNTGKTYTASTPEQVKALTDMARSMSGVGGNNTANWSITDASGKEVASDLPYTPSFLKQAGQFIADAAPQVIGTAIGGPIGGALGAMAGSGIKGGDFLDALKAGALSYGTSVGTSALGNYLAPSGTGSSFADKLLGINQPGDIWGVDRLTGAVGGAGSGGISFKDGIEQATVTAPMIPDFSGLSSSAIQQILSQSPDFAKYLAENNVSYANQPGVEEVTSTATRAPASDLTAPAALVGAGGLAALAASSTGGAPGAASGDFAGSGTSTPPASTSNGLSFADYAKLGLTGLSLLSMFGAGGSGSGSGASGASGTVPSGAGVMPSSFSTSKLPTGSDITPFGGGVTPEAMAPRDMGDVDWKRYGFGPERSFFVNVPQRAAKGGSMAVKPISDGRSDDIPAVLSDGEYVMDAETVALLGNGSNKAGAAKLDRFRANIRKQKGKELAKGRFSVNAKNPEAYLAGGRT